MKRYWTPIYAIRNPHATQRTILYGVISVLAAFFVYMLVALILLASNADRSVVILVALALSLPVLACGYWMLFKDGARVSAMFHLEQVLFDTRIPEAESKRRILAYIKQETFEVMQLINRTERRIREQLRIARVRKDMRAIRKYEKDLKRLEGQREHLISLRDGVLHAIQQGSGRQTTRATYSYLQFVKRTA